MQPPAARVCDGAGQWAILACGMPMGTARMCSKLCLSVSLMCLSLVRAHRVGCHGTLVHSVRVCGAEVWPWASNYGWCLVTLPACLCVFAFTGCVPSHCFTRIMLSAVAACGLVGRRVAPNVLHPRWLCQLLRGRNKFHNHLLI